MVTTNLFGFKNSHLPHNICIMHHQLFCYQRRRLCAIWMTRVLVHVFVFVVVIVFLLLSQRNHIFVETLTHSGLRRIHFVVVAVVRWVSSATTAVFIHFMVFTPLQGNTKKNMRLPSAINIVRLQVGMELCDGPRGVCGVIRSAIVVDNVEWLEFVFLLLAVEVFARDANIYSLTCENI